MSIIPSLAADLRGGRPTPSARGRSGVVRISGRDQVRVFGTRTNQYVEESSSPGLWCLLFGFFYFAIKGIWTHAVVGVVLACCTFGISWLIYPFFANGI